MVSSAMLLFIQTLTHWRRDKMNILQTTFSNLFSSKKIFEFRLKISLKFVSNGPINDIPALVQIMAWHRPRDNSLFEPIMVHLTTHTCITQPQWVNFTVSLLYKTSLKIGHGWVITDPFCYHFIYKRAIPSNWCGWSIAYLRENCNKNN